MDTRCGTHSPPPRRRSGLCRQLRPDAAAAPPLQLPAALCGAAHQAGTTRLSPAGRAGHRTYRRPGRLSPAGKPHLRALCLYRRPRRQSRPAAQRPGGAASGRRARRSPAAGVRSPGARYRPAQCAGPALLLSLRVALARDALLRGSAPMNQVLLINASAQGAASHANRLALDLVACLRQAHPALALVERPVGTDPLPALSQAYVQALTTATPFDAPELTLSETLIRELEQSDALLIATPLHNFTLPAALKLWIDYVLRIHRTF